MASTSLTDFRNQFLAKAQAELLAVDLTAADRNTLIINSALLRGYDSVSQFVGSAESIALFIASMSGAELETYLATDANLQWFTGVIQQPQNMTAIVSNATALATLLASTTALATVIASTTASALIFNSPYTWENNTAADNLLTSSAARLAIYNSDAALAALQANPTQIARQIGISGRCVSASTASNSFVFVPNGTKVILLRRYYSGTEYDMINWARGSTTAAVGQGPIGGGRNLDTGVLALGTQSGVYTSNGTTPTTNDATANFVSAANGLQRRAFGYGAILYVIYITV